MQDDYIQVGVTAMRNPKTGDFLPSVPLYIKATPEAVAAQEDLQIDIARIFKNKMKQYIDGGGHMPSSPKAQAKKKDAEQKVKGREIVEKYSWSFDETAEIWRNDSHDTIDACLKEARQAIQEKEHTTPEPPEVVFIGENIPYVPLVDAESVLERLQDEAYEFAGAVGKDWDAYNYKKQDELEELAKSLTSVVIDWLERHGYAPRFWAVENIRGYKL